MHLHTHKHTIHINVYAHIILTKCTYRLVYTEEENKSLKTELSELRARHKIELERVQKEKEKEMEQVHDRSVYNVCLKYDT